MNVLDAGLNYVGRWNRRLGTRALLITSSQLPGGGWRVARERTWRSGEWMKPPLEDLEEYFRRRAKETPAQTRAREAKVFVSYRSWTRTPPFGAAVAQVLTYASRDDAVASIAPLVDLMRSRTPAAVPLISQTEVSHDTPWDDTAVLLERDQLDNGESCNVRYVFGSANQYVYWLCLSSHRDPWPWDLVTQTAQKQSDRIVRWGAL